VVPSDRPREQVLRTPPLVCIEILSPEDRWTRMCERISYYLAFGVRHVFLLDPDTRKAYLCTAEGMRKVKELRMDDPEIVVPLLALFE
jgi:Uma2 family endonuclease